jgi:hypothetical protein
VAGHAGEAILIELAIDDDSCVRPPESTAMGLWQLSQWRANWMPLVCITMLTLVR